MGLRPRPGSGQAAYVLRGLARLGIGIGLCGLGGVAHADEPIELRQGFAGAVDFFATGAPLAKDGPDADVTMVDESAQPATAQVTNLDLPANAKLRKAFLYWGGSIPNDGCAGDTIDDEVQFAGPGKNLEPVAADVCYCSEAGSQSYDMQLCRKDVTALLGDLVGSYTVDGFSALINNTATSNASFSIVLVYSADGLAVRRIGLYDGLLTMASSVNQTEVVVLDGIEIDEPPAGDLTWYVLEGDVGGGGTEMVRASGLPGAKTADLSDGINPADNPMNHTINTTDPVQTDAIGVDIDQFDISGALTFGDDTVETTYQAGIDKYWIGYNIVGVNVSEPLFGVASTKNWSLHDDADQNQEPSPGDIVRYTIRLENTGSATGIVKLEDVVPAEAASWMMIDAGGGVDASTMDTAVIEDIVVPESESVDVIFDVVVADVPDETAMANVAVYDASPEGDAGDIVAPDVIIRRDGDEDGAFDNDDNCPDDANADQGDADGDGVGDVCDDDEGETGGEETEGPTTDSGSGETGSDGGSGTGDGSGGQGDGDGSGCGCVGGSASGLGAGLGLALLLVRRRRRR